MEALQRVATSMKTSKRSRTLAYLTGAGSVLDLTGCSRWFEELAPGRPRDRHPDAGLAKDLSAVGKDLENAFLRYVERIPKDQGLDLRRGLKSRCPLEVARPDRRRVGGVDR